MKREEGRAAPMSDQIRIPCVMMRGGTSRGPFFLGTDLPSDPVRRDALLLSVMGAGHELEIDGIVPLIYHRRCMPPCPARMSINSSRR